MLPRSRLALVIILFARMFARADVVLFVAEPFGEFGHMNPTGHAAIYLTRICAASPTSLRRCETGENGVVISRYHRVAGYDWLAVPLMPYLYAVESADEIPESVDAGTVAFLRDRYRQEHLQSLSLIHI